jgi:hypothetical protein
MAGLRLHLQKSVLSHQRYLQRGCGYAGRRGIYIRGADIRCVFAAGDVSDFIPQDDQKILGWVCVHAGIKGMGAPVDYRVPFVDGRSCKRAGSRENAVFRAKASALYVDSILWWLFTPYRFSTCSVVPDPMAKA